MKISFGFCYKLKMSNLKKAATTVGAKAPAVAAKVEKVADKAKEVKQDIEAAIQAVTTVGAELPGNIDMNYPVNLN